MKLVLTGLPPREAAALRIFAGVAMAGWECQVHAGKPGDPVPAADLYVADLAGLGLATWSVRTEADLRTQLRGRPAVLLLAASNGSWAEPLAAAGGMFQGVVKPYNSEAMRQALTAVAAHAAKAPLRPAPAPSPVAATPAPARTMAGALARPATGPTPPPPPHWQASRALDDIALQTLFPQIDQHPLLKKLMFVVASGTAHELRPTLRQSLIVHPGQGWVAHNIDPGVLERLDKLPSAVAAMSMRELSTEEALDRVERLGATRLPLDTFVWRLADAALGPDTPSPQRDAQISLRSFPGFTRIPGASNLHVQLAAICVRVPQTLSGLRAVFPRAEHAAIARFVLLSTLAGLGQLQVQERSAGALPRAAAAPRPGAPRAGGFMRALLQKLF